MSGSGTLSGTITKDLTIKKGTYYIDGLVRITDGVKLTIEPGATFYAKTTTTSGLIILKGAKAYMEGTATEPIVFTTESKNLEIGAESQSTVMLLSKLTEVALLQLLKMD